MGDVFPSFLADLKQEAIHIRNHWWMYGFESKPTLQEVYDYLDDVKDLGGEDNGDIIEA